MERRIAAILAADMVGFSRLIEADEAGVLTRQKRHRTELIDPGITRHRGRIVKLTGDGLIAEFGSVVDAVKCAVEIQEEMAAREADTPVDLRIQYRVAINLGDVVFDEGDIYGDGVNIAARLEALAEPGGVVVSGEAYDHLKAKVDVGYRALGEMQLKNISTPVRVYHVVPDGGGVMLAPPPSSNRHRPSLRRLAVYFSVIAIIAGAFVGSQYKFGADSLHAAAPPRVAVLPFENLGGEDWFVDGLVEDVITRLSRFDDLSVISRRSTFLWKNREGDVASIAADLEADYLVEGSVRRAEDSIRISARLINADNGASIWSEEWTRSLTAEEVFSLQDELTRTIAAEIGGMGGAIAQTRRGMLAAEVSPDIAGYECVLLARHALQIFDSRAVYDQASSCLDRSVQNTPGFAQGWAWKANILTHGITAGFEPPVSGMPELFNAADRAFDIAPNTPTVRAMSTSVQFWRQDKDAVIAEARTMAEHDAGDAEAMAWAGFWLIHMGRFEEGEGVLDQAFELTPNPPWFYHFGRFHARYGQGDMEGALSAVYPRGEEATIYWWHLFAAAALVELDRLSEANDAIAKAKAIAPDLEPVVAQTPEIWWWGLPDLGAGYVAAFKAAGLELP